MNKTFQNILVATTLMPILFWLAYILRFKTNITPHAGGDFFFLLWGVHLIVAYILNWTMMTVVIQIKPNKYFYWERIMGLVLGLFLYTFFFARLVLGDS